MSFMKHPSFDAGAAIRAHAGSCAGAID